MKPIYKSLLALVSLSVLGAYAAAPTTAPAAVAGRAAGWHGHHWGAAGGELRHVLKQLNLTPEQHTQVQGIMAQAIPQIRSLMDSSHANRMAMASTAPTNPDYPALLATAKSDAAARIQQRADIWSQIYAVLTPAQQAQIPQIIAAQRAKWAAGEARWHGPEKAGT